MQAKVLVIGGGFAGLYAALAARRFGGAAVRVDLISAERSLTIRPRLYESRPETLSVPLDGPLREAGIGFETARVIDIDGAARVVRTVELEDRAYDRLVLCTGSVMTRPSARGSDQALSIDNLKSALAFDRRLAELVWMERPRIVVVGAGFTGLELALELRDRLSSHGFGRGAESAEVVLLDRFRSPEMVLGRSAAEHVAKALERARIQSRLVPHQITEMSDRHVLFASGERLDAHAVVCCTGMSAQSLTARVASSLDPQMRVITDRYLRSPDHREIFVAGDTAHAPTDGDHAVGMSCQHAIALGKFAGENAARDLLGAGLLEFVPERYATCLSLGRSGAVMTHGWERTVVATGQRAKAMKREINEVRIYPPVGDGSALLKASRIPL